MERDLPEPSLYTVKAIIILDSDGRRLVAKYYDVYPTLKEQKSFERNLFQKTHKANAEIVMIEGLTCVYRSNVDLFFYVIGKSQENELILSGVLNTFYEAISQLLRKNVEKAALLENLDLVFLALDELCDRGIIMEVEPASLVQRVSYRHEEVPLGEQSVAQVFQQAKDQIKWNILKS